MNALEGNSYLEVRISCGPGILPCLYPIFQRGFMFPCQVGKSMEDLLMGQLALERAFIDAKISTLFLDGRAVDDLSTAMLKEGAVAALSSAMPGLAGATLRRCGVYASLRDTITHRTNQGTGAEREGVIIVKLFNLLMADLGRVFLEKGIVLDRAAALDLFKSDNQGLWRHVEQIEVGGLIMSPEEAFNKVRSGCSNLVMVRAVMGRQDCPSDGDERIQG